MAVQKIEYENKTYLQNDTNIPEKNKVTEANMNEIKETVNNNADELSTAQQNIENLQEGQGTASGDIASLKNRVTTLEGDNTKNKQDIANKVDKVEGKGLSTEDYTTAEKQKLAGLNNYDDTEIKQDIQEINEDISDIKSEQETQNDLLERTQSALINITTPKSSNINVKDSSDLNAKIDVYGISEQDGEPSPSNIVDIENVTGDIDITVCNKNLFNCLKWLKMNHANGYPVAITDNTNTAIEIIKETKNSIKYNQKSAYYGVLSEYIPVKKGQIFTLSFNYININRLFVTQYDKDKTRIKELNNIGNVNTTTFTVEQDGFITIAFSYSNATPNENTIEITNIQLEVGTVKTDYIENEQQAITFPLGEGQRLYNGDYLASDGIHHKRTQVEFDGTENWGVIYENIFWMEFSDTKLFTSAIMTHFKYVKKSLTELLDNEFTTSAGQGHAFWIKKEGMALEEFKSFLSQQKQAGTPLVVEYELAEETVEAYTEEQQEAYNQLQNVLSYKTETNVFTDKAQLVFKYIADTKTYVDNETNTIKEQLNTINELLSTTATSATLLENLQSDLESEVT